LYLCTDFESYDEMRGPQVPSFIGNLLDYLDP